MHDGKPMPERNVADRAPPGDIPGDIINPRGIKKAAYFRPPAGVYGALPLTASLRIEIFRVPNVPVGVLATNNYIPYRKKIKRIQNLCINNFINLY
jgi:hypothetical protein